MGKRTTNDGKVIRYRNRRREQRLLLIFLVLLAAVAVALALLLVDGGKTYDRLRRSARYRQDVEIQLESSGSHRSGSFLGGLALVDSSGLAVFDRAGTPTYRTATPMDHPVLRIAGEFALNYDVGGKSLSLYQDGKGVVLSAAADGKLFDADLSEDGYVTTVCQGNNTKTILRVYNRSFSVSYTVYSSTRYFNCCAIAPGGSHVVVSALGQKDGVFNASGVIYSTGREEPLAEISLGNQLIYDLFFLDRDTVCAVGQTSVVFFDCDGTLLGQYPYSSLLDFAFCDSAVVLELPGTTGGSSADLVTVNTNGKELGRTSIHGAVYAISAAGKYLAALTDSGLTLYDKNMQPWSSTEDTRGASAVAMCDDGSAFLVGSRSAWRYLP